MGARSLLQAQTALLEAEGRLSEQAAEIIRLQQQLAVANADAGTMQALKTDLEAAESRASEQKSELAKLRQDLSETKAECADAWDLERQRRQDNETLEADMEAAKDQLAAAESRQQALLADVALLTAAVEASASLLEATLQPGPASDMATIFPDAAVDDPPNVLSTTTEENTDPEGDVESAQDVEATAARVRHAAQSATAQIATLRADLESITSERDRAAAAAAGLGPALARAESEAAAAAAESDRERAETERRLREGRKKMEELAAALEGCRALLRQSQEEGVNSQATCDVLRERLQTAEKRAGKASAILPIGL